MIFPEHKIIFLHSGKTAGSAFELMLCPKVRKMPANTWNEEHFYGLKDGVYHQHAAARHMYEDLPREIWEEYTKVTIVRCPYERLYSVYNYTYKQHEKKWGSFENFILNLPQPDYRSCSHYLPQWDYCAIDGELVVDEVLHFNNLAEDVQVFREKYQISQPFKKYNLFTNPDREKGDARGQYTREMLVKMWDIYADDFDYLIDGGYYREQPSIHRDML